MTGTWFSIRVDLVAGHGELYWPRPGRIFAAAPTHTFAQLATAIDDAFARWDRSHLHQFTRSDGSELGIPSREDEISGPAAAALGAPRVLYGARLCRRPNAASLPRRTGSLACRRGATDRRATRRRAAVRARTWRHPSRSETG